LIADVWDVKILKVEVAGISSLLWYRRYRLLPLVTSYKTTVLQPTRQ